MTVKIAECWDIWYQKKELEYDISCRFMLKDFGVDGIILIPDLEISQKISDDYMEASFLEMNSIEDVLKANPALIPALVDERGDCHLRDFKYP